MIKTDNKWIDNFVNYKSYESDRYAKRESLKL